MREVFTKLKFPKWITVCNTNYKNRWGNGKTFHDNYIKPLNHEADNKDREAGHRGRWSKDSSMRSEMRSAS